jgi:hypothetical protein
VGAGAAASTVIAAGGIVKDDGHRKAGKPRENEGKGGSLLFLGGGNEEKENAPVAAAETAEDERGDKQVAAARLEVGRNELRHLSRARSPITAGDAGTHAEKKVVAAAGNGAKQGRQQRKREEAPSSSSFHGAAALEALPHLHRRRHLPAFVVKKASQALGFDLLSQRTGHRKQAHNLCPTHNELRLPNPQVAASL